MPGVSLHPDRPGDRSARGCLKVLDPGGTMSSSRMQIGIGGLVGKVSHLAGREFQLRRGRRRRQQPRPLAKKPISDPQPIAAELSARRTTVSVGSWILGGRAPRAASGRGLATRQRTSEIHASQHCLPPRRAGVVVGSCCRGTTLTVRCHEAADDTQTVGDRPDDDRPDRPTCPPLRRCGDAEVTIAEPPPLVSASSVTPRRPVMGIHGGFQTGGLSERRILAQFRYTLASFVSPTTPSKLSPSTRPTTGPRLAIHHGRPSRGNVVLERARLSGFNPPEVVAPDRPQKPVAR